MLSPKDKEGYQKGNTQEKKRILEAHLKICYSVLKSSPELNLLLKAQGRIEILEDLIDTLD